MYVAGDKDSGNAGFEVVGCSIEGPPLRCDAVGGEVGACEDKSMAISNDHVAQPFRQRSGADEDEQPLRVDGLFFASCSVQQRYSLEMIVAVCRDYLCARADRNLRVLLDLLNQLVGNGCFE
jgi:hypothetical protein